MYHWIDSWLEWPVAIAYVFGLIMGALYMWTTGRTK